MYMVKHDYSNSMKVTIVFCSYWEIIHTVKKIIYINIYSLLRKPFYAKEKKALTMMTFKSNPQNDKLLIAVAKTLIYHF